MVEPAPFTQDQIIDAVNSINPRGRTPMADSVVAAARSLRHTENAATVILVSDGIENCNPDPCAIARELEETGVGFTAHVIGFDVSAEPEAQAQMQCIAESTGGLFLTADNAEELGAALDAVVAAVPTMMRLEARIEGTGDLAERPITWRIIGEANTIVAEGLQGAAVDFAFDAGLYTLEATREEPSGPATYQENIIVVEGQSDLAIVTMPEIILPARVTFSALVAPDMSAPVSPLNWTLFDPAGTVLLGPVTTPNGIIDLPPGDYRFEVERVETETVHEALFGVEAGVDQEVVIELPARLMDVTFSARIGSDDGPLIMDPVIWEIGPETSEEAMANPATISLGTGAYSVTAFWTVQEVEQTVDFVVVNEPRDIIVVFEEPLPSATVSTVPSAEAGSTIEVTWSGPEEDGDFIAIRAVDATGFHRFANTTRIEQGSPLPLLIPSEPGEYVVEYVLGDGRIALAETAITVTPANATLVVPASAIAGSTIEVGWTGPDNGNDFIAVRQPDSEGFHRFINTTRTRDGSPLRLLMPTAPGTYVIEYVEAQDRTALAAVNIEITEATSSLTLPSSAPAGSTISVEWTGPDYRNDFIAVRHPNSEGFHRFINTTRTKDGSPLQLLMPTEPGLYVVEYVEAQDRLALASEEIEVTAVTATLVAPPTAPAGSSPEIGWTGPDYRNDFIAIRHPDSTGFHRFINTTRTNKGSPLTLLMPSEPGRYIIEYVESQDRSALVSSEVEVTAVSATLVAPATAAAGTTLEVGWTGPGYPRDLITIRLPDREGFHRFEKTVRADRGNPAKLALPDEPGEYIIEYVEGQDRTPLAEARITLQ